MKITKITAFAIKIPRDVTAGRGTAGSPAPLEAGASDYRFAATYQTLYSSKIETALIKIETDAGITGWGEAQAPVAPEVVVGFEGRCLLASPARAKAATLENSSK